MTRHAVWHMWRLSEADDDNLGLACSDDGLLLGRTRLIERRDGKFVARQQQDIERLLTCAYRTEVRADRLMSGLATVARALSANDQCLARIAAVHLRIPDIPDRTARDAMEGRTSSPNTRAMRAAIATGIRLCIHAPAHRQIPAGLRQRTILGTSHFPCEPHRTTTRHAA